MMEINKPEIVAEVTAAFERYEHGLMEHDEDILNDTFWENDLTLRFGITENAYSHAAIAKVRTTYRAGRRTLMNTIITTYGDDFATANTEYKRIEGGREGRQSQTWVRTEEGWKVVCAHVSWLD